MAVYLNGRLPAAALAVIPGTGVKCPAEFVAQVAALRAAFFARFGKPLVITDGYRPYSGNYYAQVETMLRRYKPAAEFRAITGGASTAGRKSHVWNGVRRYLLPGQAQVAFPGTSNHGRADRPALDLGSGVTVMDSVEHRWVVANAPLFGFRWPAEWARAGREPWHIEGVGVITVSTGGTATTPVFTIPDATGLLPGALTPEDDMFDADTHGKDLAELLRLVRLQVLAPSGHAQPSTGPEAEYVETAGATPRELRRMFGVLLGYQSPANDTERAALALLRGEGDDEDDRENRRMLGVLLGWQEPVGPEQEALAALRQAAANDEPGAASAVADEIARRLTNGARS